MAKPTFGDKRGFAFVYGMQPRLLLCAVLFCILPSPSAGLYDKDETKVILLDDKNFDQEVMESDDSFWVVEFYAPWCGHCKQFAPQYEKIAGNLQGLVKVAAVDCDVHKSLCSKFGIRGFPTIKIVPVEKSYNPYTKKTSKLAIDYNGPRTAKGMVENVLGQLPNYVHSVKADNHTSFLEDNFPKALLFTEKDVVAPLFKALAIQFKGRIRLGQASSKDKELVEKFGVTSFPKLIAVSASDSTKTVAHDGKIKKEELIQFLDVHALKEKKEDPILESFKPKSMSPLGPDKLDTVLKDEKDIWLVFYHKGGRVPSEVQQLAGSLKAFKHASFDCAKAPDVCKANGVSSLPALRMYQQDKNEYEDFTGAADCMEDCFELSAMADFVGEQMPNLVKPVTEPTWTGFLAPAAERPRPLLFTKKEEPSALYKSVALHYKDVLTFGLFANPSQKMMDQLQVKKLPQLLIFFSQNGTAESVQAFPYPGGFTFEEMVGVLDQFAKPFMDKPKEEKSSRASSAPPTGPIPEISKEAEEQSFDALCGKKSGLCAIFFLDGSEANKEKREEQLKNITALRTKKHPSPYQYMWADAVCHSTFAASFDVTADKLPAMVIVSPSKQRYVQHIGKFADKELDLTLDGVLTGRKKTGPYTAIGELEQRSCAEVHAEILAATSGGGGSAEDDEIMKEMMEEIERKRKEAEDEDEEEGSGSKKSKKKKKKSKKKK